jgi:hypothetical protein
LSPDLSLEQPEFPLQGQVMPLQQPHPLQVAMPVQQDFQDLEKVCLLSLVRLLQVLGSFQVQRDQLEPQDRLVQQLTPPQVPPLESSPDLSRLLPLQHSLPEQTGRVSSIHQFLREPSMGHSSRPE